GKRSAIRPCPGVILGEKNLSVAESKGFVVALRIDVWPLGGEVEPEMLVFPDGAAGGAEMANAGASQAIGRCGSSRGEALPAVEWRLCCHRSRRSGLGFA